MSVVVSLREVIDSLELPSSEWTAYLNTATGEIITISDDDRRFVEDDTDANDLPEWQRDELPKIREAVNNDRLLALPDNFEIHEWDIMRQFADSRDDELQRRELSSVIHGSGAFRRFHDCLRRLEIDQQWFRFREARLRQIAKDWLEARGIAYQ